MKSLKSLLEKLLNNEINEDRFYSRKLRYNCIENYIPGSFNDIIGDTGPWYIHGLAFRMATFSSESELFFERLNTLLEISENLDGWCNESENTGLSWSRNYDELFQHLWMLQCVEYFTERECYVCFAGRQGRKAPDLKVKSDEEKYYYVECYVYSKWWFFEIFIEDVIGLIDPHLQIERTYNTQGCGSHVEMKKIMDEICGILSPSNLESAKVGASQTSPYIMYDRNGIQLSMHGEGVYQASQNAHGDPSMSANVYVKEIIANKQDRNDLKSHRPNLLMVNGLGIDFQNILFANRVGPISFQSDSIDELELYACGIDEKVSSCTRKLSTHNSQKIKMNI